MSIDPFEEVAQKRAALWNAFSGLPISSVSGLVDLSGVGGSNIPPNKLWSLHLTLVAWRVDDGPIHKGNLVITKMIPREEISSLQDKIEEESIISFTGRVCESSPFGDDRAELIELFGTTSDPELEQVKQELQQPVIIDHVLGKFTLDRRIDWFEGEVTWLNKPIRLTVSLDESGNTEQSFATASALFSEMRDWSMSVCSFAVSKLLELKNDTWLDECEDEITENEFIAKMRLESISVTADGAFEFWHNDGGLFLGHSIMVSGTLKDGPTDADIPG